MLEQSRQASSMSGYEGSFGPMSVMYLNIFTTSLPEKIRLISDIKNRNKNVAMYRPLLQGKWLA